MDQVLSKTPNSCIDLQLLSQLVHSENMPESIMDTLKDYHNHSFLTFSDLPSPVTDFAMLLSLNAITSNDSMEPDVPYVPPNLDNFSRDLQFAYQILIEKNWIRKDLRVVNSIMAEIWALKIFSKIISFDIDPHPSKSLSS